MAWNNRSAAFRARVRLPAAASPQGGIAILTLQPAVANAAFASHGAMEYFAPPVVAAVDPSRATVDGRTSAVGGRSVAVTVRGLPVAAGPADLVVSFVPEGGGELVCDGAACSLLQVTWPTTRLNHPLQRIMSPDLLCLANFPHTLQSVSSSLGPIAGLQLAQPGCCKYQALAHSTGARLRRVHISHRASSQVTLLDAPRQ